MQFSNGVVEIDDSEAAIIEAFFFRTVERTYPASTFVGMLENAKTEAELQKKNYMSAEQTSRTTLQIELIQMLINTCDLLLNNFLALTNGSTLISHLN